MLFVCCFMSVPEYVTYVILNTDIIMLPVNIIILHVNISQCMLTRLCCIPCWHYLSWLYFAEICHQMITWNPQYIYRIASKSKLLYMQARNSNTSSEMDRIRGNVHSAYPWTMTDFRLVFFHTISKARPLLVFLLLNRILRRLRVDGQVKQYLNTRTPCHI